MPRFLSMVGNPGQKTDQAQHRVWRICMESGPCSSSLWDDYPRVIHIICKGAVDEGGSQFCAVANTMEYRSVVSPYRWASVTATRGHADLLHFWYIVYERLLGYVSNDSVKLSFPSRIHTKIALLHKITLSSRVEGSSYTIHIYNLSGTELRNYSDRN